MSPARHKAERSVLSHFFPAVTVAPDASRVSGALHSNSGAIYMVLLEIPATYPDSVPAAYVTSPVLLDHAGRRMASHGVSGTMHLLGARGDELQICHSHPQHWQAADTLYTVLLKVRLWIEAYELHLRTGNAIDHYLKHA